MPSDHDSPPVDIKPDNATISQHAGNRPPQHSHMSSDELDLETGETYGDEAERQPLPDVPGTLALDEMLEALREHRRTIESSLAELVKVRAEANASIKQLRDEQVRIERLLRSASPKPRAKRR